MKVLVIGTEDMTGEHVVKQLAEKQHEPVALAGAENKVEGLEKMGAARIVVTEDSHYADAFSDCDAVIYVGSASPRTGEGKPILIDHQSVVQAIEEAKEHGVKRFVLMSAMRTHDTKSAGSSVSDTKNQPEELLRNERLTYTIVRTSMPVDKPGEGTVKAAHSLKGEIGEIAKEDIASLLVEALEAEEAFNKTFEVSSGDTPIRKALRSL